MSAEIFTGILIFKGFTARRLYKSFGVKGLKVKKLPYYILYRVGSVAQLI
jgi:hypothetical protein